MSTKPQGKRTKSGCWTCRLRRKKCSEGGPPCDNCQSRRVHCHGYGPKPEWKDRGTLEREEARKLQYQSGRARSYSTSTTAASPSSNEGSAVSSSNIGGLTPEDGDNVITASSSLPTGRLMSPIMPDPSFSLDTNGFPMDFQDCSSPSNYTSVVLDSLDAIDGAASLDWPQFHPNNSELSVLTPTVVPPSSDVENLWTCGDLVSSQGVLQVQSEIPSAQPQDDPRLAEGENGIDLMMHYIAHMSSRQNRESIRVSEMGWLMLLLTRSSAFYYATLSLSSYHKYIGRCENSAVRADALRDYEKYRTRSLKLLNELSSNPLSKEQGTNSRFSLCERLISSVQLAYLEALSGNVQDFQTQIDTAAQLLVDHESVLVTGTKQFSTMERKCLTFFTVRLIWNDVLIRSTKRLAPKAEMVYRRLLEDETWAASFKEFTTCESWVMLSIMDSTILSSWKHDQESSGSLSIKALVGHAEKIEKSVEKQIQRLSDTRNIHLDSVASRPNNTAPICTLPDDITINSLIFAHAILTDLHQIVSGPQASVPEISDSIDRSIASAWKLRHEPTVFDNVLAWPYCVTASLTRGEQRGFFRDMTGGPEAGRTGSLESGVQQLKSIVEQSWAGSSPTRSDWKDIVKRSNQLGIFCI